VISVLFTLRRFVFRLYSLGRGLAGRVTRKDIFFVIILSKRSTEAVSYNNYRIYQPGIDSGESLYDTTSVREMRLVPAVVWAYSDAGTMRIDNVI